ncbi:hypothetical protein JOE63_000407 [Cellulosimicrobium cellulans]|uniref:hypothetical protein n=1 Tax=Cellulosimicrobium cellulans TaxID=1710 RepID=UPI00195A8773|nr:hypothetical protein [Cellulosimicrobium cellulans]MBM7817930.1 hypothetical protein [Cellulosimicrobium cellulans]
MTARGTTPPAQDAPARTALVSDAPVRDVPVRGVPGTGAVSRTATGPGSDAPEPVLSVVVMHHPARGDVSSLVAACAPLDVRVVEDPDPDGPPSPLRTAKRAWAAVAPGATHHLVLQDDVTPVPGFAELVLRAVRARGRHAVALYSNWNSPRNAYLVRAAAVAGQAWAPLGHDEWVPTLGLVLPAEGALRLAAHLATLPDDERDDDEAVVTFCAREGYPVVATLPHLLEHGDGPSLAGNDAHGARHATVPAGDAVDPDAWDRPGLDREPARSPATARPVAVTLERSRCTLRVLRPGAGEPLEHPFGWGWDAWSWWLGVDPAAVAHDVSVLVAGASPELRRVSRDALGELGAACWLLGHDVARSDWPPPAGPDAPAHRAAAVRTWVLSGLLPADRPEDLVDELVAFGLDALLAGETWTGTPSNPGIRVGSTPGSPTTPGSAPVVGAGASDGAAVDQVALAAARLLGERDAEVVCRAAGPAVPVRVVVHDCPACGARAEDAVRRLTAQVDLDGAAEHRVAGTDEHRVAGADEYRVAGTDDAAGAGGTPSGPSDRPVTPLTPEALDVPDAGAARETPDGRSGRAVVEILACEHVEPRGLLGVDPGRRYVSRGLWAARRVVPAPPGAMTGEPHRTTAHPSAAAHLTAAGAPVPLTDADAAHLTAAGAPVPLTDADTAHLTAAEVLVALAAADAAHVLPVAARVDGDAPGRASLAALGLQHAPGLAQRYADLHAEVRLARAVELL